MKKIVLTESGGFPLKQYTLDKMQMSYFELFYSMLNFLGINETTGKYIIKGCEVSAGVISAGWLFIDGELVKFEGAAGNATTKLEKVVTAETAAFKNGQNKPVYITSAVQITTTGTPLSEFTRITQIVPLPEGIVIDPNYSTISQRLTELERKASVFQAGGGMVLWNKPAGLIPNGWAEVVDWRGRIPAGMDATLLGEDFVNPEFSPLEIGDDGPVPGRTGGAKNKTLVTAEMPKHKHTFETNGDNALDNNTSGYPHGRQNDDNRDQTHNTSLVGGDVETPEGQGRPFSILNPYRTVLFIEYVGIVEP